MKERVALVTGASRGIGREIAKEMAAAGYRVAVAARNKSELQTLVDQIGAAGGSAHAVVADLGDRGAPAQIDDAVRRHWGPIEVLINNAGIGSSADPRPLVEFDDAFWDQTLALNVTAPYLLTKQVLPTMIERGWGRIINVSSINATIPALHGAAYTASKHALAGLTKATARETVEHGITCNAICPGVTHTAMNDKRLDYDVERTGQSFEELERSASPLGRRIEPDEIAPLAVFLASDGARAINGQLINVCGGTVMG